HGKPATPEVKRSVARSTPVQEQTGRRVACVGADLSAKALAEATTFRSECTVLFADKSAPTGNPLHLRSSEASSGPLPPEVREMGLYPQDLCITLSAYPRHEHQPQNHPITQ
ncbi:hypothetical protein A249_00075, partial [Pseudomonas syringae pv. actinidiae ICMP 18804]